VRPKRGKCGGTLDPRDFGELLRHHARDLVVRRHAYYRDQIPLAGHRVDLNYSIDTGKTHRHLRDALRICLDEYDCCNHDPGTECLGTLSSHSPAMRCAASTSSITSCAICTVCSVLRRPRSATIPPRCKV